MEIRKIRGLLLIALRDLKKFIESKYWLAGQIAMNLADVFIFALVLRGFIRKEFIPDYLRFIAPGTVALATFVATFSIGREVGMEIRRGVVDYLLVLPLERIVLVIGRIVGGALRGLIYQIPFILIASFLVSPPSIDKVAILVFTSIILTLSMSGLAIAISTTSRDFNIQVTARALAYYLLFFFSNVFYTKTALEYRFPKPISDTIELMPISLAADIYRWCFNYYASLEMREVVLLSLWCIVLTSLAAVIYLRNLTRR